MINFNEERTTAVLYTCGVCNLNCRYCTIDKNPVLKDIDKELEESFKGDYYFNRIKEYFPRRDQLKRVETWGGEPFLKMDRIYPLVHQLINYYPYFDSMFSSTNFSYPEWIDQFMGLMNCFAEYPYRQFTYDLQLSVDGPPYINDANRGAGVTQRCIDNFDKLLQIIKDGKFPKNVYLSMGLKGTLDTSAFYHLNDKQKIIEYYQFYEDAYISKVRELNIPKIEMGISIPNTAVPTAHTKHDGEVFAEFIKKCREIEAENQTKHYFKYYEQITPFSLQSPYDCGRFWGEIYCCGSGKALVGFLPHNMVSACHEGFTLLVDEYKKFAANRSSEGLVVSLNKFFELNATPMCLTDDQYVEHERKMKYLDFDSNVQATMAANMIMGLAMAGLIDQKYIYEGQALMAAKTVLAATSYCIKANYATTGSFITEPTDLYILLLNGALDYLMDNTGGCNCGNCNKCE